MNARTTQCPRCGSPELLAELRATLPLIVLAAVGTTAGIGLGIATDRATWPVYLAVVVLGGVLVAALHLRFRLSQATLTGLVFFALGHLAGGMVPVGGGVLYERWLIAPLVRYDTVQHAVGFGVVGRAAWEMLSRRLGPASADRAVALWTILFAAGALGAVNEIVEWVLTLTIPGTDVGGYDNTARDLIANLVGGALAATWTVHRLPPRAVTLAG